MVTKEILKAKLERGDLIAWMPEDDWQAQRAGAILLPRNHNSSKDIHISFLADRVQMLIDETESPEEMFYQMIEQMKQENLLQDFMFPSPENLHSDIFLSNWNLQERISYLGINEKLPQTVTTHNPEAAEIFMGMDLENWLSSLAIY